MLSSKSIINIPFEVDSALTRFGLSVCLSIVLCTYLRHFKRSLSVSLLYVCLLLLELAVCMSLSGVWFLGVCCPMILSSFLILVLLGGGVGEGYNLFLGCCCFYAVIAIVLCR